MQTPRRNLTPSTLRLGRRYRPNRVEGRYDALVIGSGIGGLTTAALLSEIGWRVAVLEQHYTAGGATHSYDRAGYEWDVGVHYIGDMGARTTSRRMMDFLTQGNLHWAPMDSHYDRFFIGERTYDAVAGRDAYRDNLVGYFPREAAAIDRYLELLGETARGMRTFSLDRTLPPWAAAIAGPFLRSRLPRSFGRTTWEVLSELTRDAELIAVLTGQWGDLGLPPKRSAWVIQALVAKHYLHGGFYPVGGAWRIADTILPRIRAAGGEVFTYARVQEVLLEPARRHAVRGVRMEDGSEIACDCVISDAGALNTFGHLVPEETRRRVGYDRLLARVKPSIGHLCVYIGLKGRAEDLGLPKTNYWIYHDNDYDAAYDRFAADPHGPFPAVYISFPSAKDPDFERRHPGRSTIEIVAPAPYSIFEPWAGTTWGKRGDDYEALKQAFGERLLEHLYAKLPALRDRIDYWEISTPLSMQWFCGYARGELYGLDHDPERMRQSWLRPRTRIPGLWLTGQDVMSCGVTGAMMGGLASAVSIGGTRRMAPVLKGIFG
ncbi:MAG TPA: NAD(P)/FAD-dependent oxidoreductase [Steroidobacteraceae bacterium]|nr:NAD(P)/FAD-dependent oxidoreductase [Steroidobacteraceae bacterium]